jgi:TolB-like protein
VQRLVVGQFTYGQGVNQFTKDLQEKLVTAFAAKGLQVVEREKLEKVLEEQQLGYSGLLNVDSAKKIGELLGAEGIILGTISDMGNDISLNGRLVDIGSGDTVSAAEVKLVKTSLIGQLLDTQIKNSPLPANKPKAGGGNKKDGKPEVQEVEGFEFAITGCKRTGKTATCSFTIVNKQEDRYLDCSSGSVYGSQTIVVDNLGNSYKPDKIQLANCENYSCSQIIVDNLPTRASFVIDDVSSEATSAAKVVLDCTQHGNKLPSVSFRDVVFSE